MNKEILIIENKIYEKSEGFLIRDSNWRDYYSNRTKIQENNLVIVPLNKCPYYSIESTVIYNPKEVKCIRIEKHFSKNHFSTPIIFKHEYHEFCGISVLGFFFRKCYYIEEKNLNQSVYCNRHFIPLTPKTIKYVANLKNKNYSEYINIINKEKNVTIFNLHGGIDLCVPDLERIS